MTALCPLGEKTTCVLAEQRDKLDVFILNCLGVDLDAISTKGQQRAVNAPSQPASFHTDPSQLVDKHQ